MLPAITLLIVLQLVGEVIARGLALPVPGPVIGLVLLLVGLMVRGARGHSPPPALEDTAQGLLRHLSLLFVPAGVGVTTLLATLREDGPAILVALAVSAVATIVVTALVMRALAPPPDAGEEGRAGDASR
jgi:holin-like protein